MRKNKANIKKQTRKVGIKTSLLLIFVVIFIGSTLVGCNYLKDFKNTISTANYHSEIKESVTSGIVIDKKTYTKTEGGGGSYGTVYTPKGGLGYGYIYGGNKTSRVVYELTVSFEITYKDGKEYFGEKTFEVSEGAYLSHNIGDFFDSLNYENKYLEEDA